MSLSKPDSAKHPKLTDADLVCQFARLSSLNKDLRELFEPCVRESMRRLVRQNKRLKIRLFYKDYCSSMLKEALGVHNQNGSARSKFWLCECQDCHILCNLQPARRASGGTSHCLLMERFLRICEQLGLVVKQNLCDGRAVFPKSIKDFKYNCTVYDVPDCDIFFGARGDWATIGYGQLITEAAGTSSPKAKALQTLLCTLFRVPTPALEDGYETDSVWEDGDHQVSDSEASEDADIVAPEGIFTPEERSPAFD